MNLVMVIFGILTLIAATGVVVSRKPLNSALYLVVTLFLVAVHFAILGADFMAAMQILIYAGAIMVLVIFVIMLLGLEADDADSKNQRIANFCSAAISGIFIAVCYLSLSGLGDFSFKSLAKQGEAQKLEFGSTEAIGELMFTTYVIPFQLVGVLLLAAIIGAVLLAFDSRRPLPEGRGLKDKQGVS